VITSSRYAPDEVRGSTYGELSESIFKAFTEKGLSDPKFASSMKKLRNAVTEGLMIVEGLLVADRSKRITFDQTKVGLDRVGKASNSLRASKALMSALEVDNSSRQSKSSCSSFMENAVENSKVLKELPIKDKSNLPAFIQDMC
jgi:hypothetical protein